MSNTKHSNSQLQYYHLQTDLLKSQSYKEFQQVIPNLYIGSQISSLNIAKLQEHKVKHILKVNGISIGMGAEKYGIRTKVMDIDDTPDAPIETIFDETHCFIKEGLDANDGVLVACTAGISRSAAIVISYLIKYHKMTYDQAYDLTKKARVYIKPNVGFERVLVKYSSECNCDLCHLVPRTTQFEQYGKKKVGKPLFKVLICDQCDGPMIVYINGHKQQLETDELLEAMELCQEVGNDFYGVSNWFIDGKQRTIADHFHWHIRPTSSKPVFKVAALATQEACLEQLESAAKVEGSLSETVILQSKELISKHLGTSSFEITGKSVQLLSSSLKSPLGDGIKEIKIKSKLKLKFDRFASIDQTVLVNDRETLRCQYRVRIGDNYQGKDLNNLIGKL